MTFYKVGSAGALLRATRILSQYAKRNTQLFHTSSVARNVVSNMSARGLVASLTRYECCPNPFKSLLDR